MMKFVFAVSLCAASAASFGATAQQAKGAFLRAQLEFLDLTGELPFQKVNDPTWQDWTRERYHTANRSLAEAATAWDREPAAAFDSIDSALSLFRQVGLILAFYDVDKAKVDEIVSRYLQAEDSLIQAKQDLKGIPLPGPIDPAVHQIAEPCNGWLSRVGIVLQTGTPLNSFQASQDEVLFDVADSDYRLRLRGVSRLTPGRRYAFSKTVIELGNSYGVELFDSANCQYSRATLVVHKEMAGPGGVHEFLRTMIFTGHAVNGGPSLKRVVFN